MCQSEETPCGEALRECELNAYIALTVCMQLRIEESRFVQILTQGAFPLLRFFIFFNDRSCVLDSCLAFSFGSNLLSTTEHLAFNSIAVSHSHWYGRSRQHHVLPGGVSHSYHLTEIKT